jgi:hypothetical protein
MKRRFRKHYTIAEARALLPTIREWLKEAQQARRRLESSDSRLTQILEGGHDAGGELVHDMVRLLAKMNSVLKEFCSREIDVKDLDRGLLDFPSIMAGREVFLCWEQDEEDIEFWHDLDAGYAGRERL